MKHGALSIQWLMKSSIGPVYLVASEAGLQGLYWKKQTVPMVKSLAGKGRALEILSRAAAQLEKYFAGKLETFTVPMDLQGTAFQKSVWRELARIPYGKTVSYSDIAARIGNKKAVRAVGTANGRNPVCIMVPCHRVIAADGSLGGYVGGLGVKSKLLELERGKRAL